MSSSAHARLESSFRRVLRAFRSLPGLAAVTAVSAITALSGAAHAGLTDEFAIGVNQIVTNGQPAPGAGNLEGPGAIDIYTFTVDPGTEILFNGLGGFSCNLRWTLKDDQGTVLFDKAIQCDADPGPLTLDGTYTITVYYNGGSGSGTYGFILVTEDLYDYFSIGLNQLVSSGAPAPGAGVLEGPGEKDIYTFTVDPGTEILFNGLGGFSCNLRWTLEDDQGTVLFDKAIQCDADPGPLTLDGTYTITVYYVGDNAGGSYGFILVTEDLYDYFSIGLNQLVSSGAPAPGAGVLEGRGEKDIYTFTVDPGTEILFNGLGGFSCNLRWTLKDAQGTVLFDKAIQCDADPGPLTLDGTYTITVYYVGDNAGGSYGFILVTEDLYDYFSIGLNQLVSSGAPAPGAGVLEGPGEKDIYTFTVDPGTEILFNGSGGFSCNLRWTLEDAQGTVLFDKAIQCDADPGPLTLDGTYTITVYYVGDNAGGSYGFILVTEDLYDYFSIGLNQLVSSGAPAPGAGVLEGPGEKDIYTFTVDPGTEILFNGSGGFSCNLRWTLEDAQGTVLFDKAIQCDADPGPLTLDGTYTITVYYVGDNAGGSYGFILCWTESPDLNCDGAVNGADLGILLGAWGPCDDCSGDLNGDSAVNGADLGILLGAWTS